MSGRRRWSDEEEDMLLGFVESHYDFLTSKVHAGKSKKDVEEKWNRLTNQINALGGVTLTVKQVTKKWSDMKSIAKQAKTAYEKESKATGGGPNKAPIPTPLQYRICDIIGTVNTAGIPNTDELDTDASIPAPTAQLALVPIPQPSIAPTPTSLNLGNAGEGSENTPSKRHNKSKRDVRDEEILSVERELVRKVDDLNAALLGTNAILAEMLNEMRRSNALQERIAGQGNIQSHATPPNIDDNLFHELQYNN